MKIKVIALLLALLVLTGCVSGIITDKYTTDSGCTIIVVPEAGDAVPRHPVAINISKEECDGYSVGDPYP